MGPHGSDGHIERVGNLFVGALFLMIEDEDGSFDLAEPLKLLFDCLLKLAFFYLLLGVAIRVREAVFPAGCVVGERDVGAVVSAAALPRRLGAFAVHAVEERSI